MTNEELYQEIDVVRGIAITISTKIKRLVRGRSYNNENYEHEIMSNTEVISAYSRDLIGRQIRYSPDRTLITLKRIKFGLDKLRNSDEFRDVILEPYGFMPDYAEKLLAIDKNTSIGQLSDVFDARFGRLVSALSQQQLSFFPVERQSMGTALPDAIRRTRQIVPAQTVGPVQFDIVNDRLVLVHRRAVAEERDASNVQSARTALMEQGGRILEQLRQSNCDHRFIACFEALQEKLISDTDIIQLGFANIGTEIMVDQFRHELPDAVIAIMRTQTTQIGMYVAQYPDWAKFLENAAKAKLTPQDIQTANNTAKQLVITLTEAKDKVDPDVPKTIEFIRSLLDKPGDTLIKTAFALIKTIENLVAKVFSYGVDFLDATAKTTINYGKHAVALWLVSMAMRHAADMSPIAAKLGDGKWMSEAADLMKHIVESNGD